MEAPIRRPSNVDAMPRAGAYWFTDQPGDEPLRVTVNVVHGECIIVFPDDEETQLRVKELPDWENWPEHLRRIG